MTSCLNSLPHRNIAVTTAVDDNDNNSSIDNNNTH